MTHRIDRHSFVKVQVYRTQFTCCQLTLPCEIKGVLEHRAKFPFSLSVTRTDLFKPQLYIITYLQFGSYPETQYFSSSKNIREKHLGNKTSVDRVACDCNFVQQFRKKNRVHGYRKYSSTTTQLISTWLTRKGRYKS